MLRRKEYESSRIKRQSHSGALFLFDKQCHVLNASTLMDLFMESTLIMAVGGVRLEDVAVSGFQFFLMTVDLFTAPGQIL